MKRLFKNISLLFSCIPNTRKFHLFFILCFTIFCSLIEILSLSSIIPLLNLFNDPTIIVENGVVNVLSKIIPVNYNNFSTIAKIFISLAIIATVCRVSLIWISNNLSQSIFADLTTQLFSQNLNQDYLKFKRIDSNEAVSNLLIKSSTIQSTITSVINVMISTIMILFILTTLFYVEPLLTFYSFLMILIFYLIISTYTTKIFRLNGGILAREVPNQLGIINSALRSYKNVIIENLENFNINKYRKSIMKVKKISVANIFLSQSPRYLLEGVIMVLVGVYLIYIFNSNQGQFVKISTLAFIAASAQRLLPILHTLYTNFQSFNSNHQSLADVLSTLKHTRKKNKIISHKNIITFKSVVEFKNVSFRYSKKEKWILRNISFTIKKGEIVGLVGESGNGKTTLIDLLSGLISPSEGKIIVDGININTNKVAWRRNIGLVPQEPFYFDTSVKNNITMNDAEQLKNKKNLNQVIDIFYLKDLVRLNRIGDNGALLSGGQKQRISLARAFYKKNNILILDEATNALDAILEKKILNNIEKYYPNRTILIIAHKPLTLSICNNIVDLNKINNI